MTYCPTRRVGTAHQMDVNVAASHRSVSAPLLLEVGSTGARLHHPGSHADRTPACESDSALVETVALLEAAAIALGAQDLTAESLRCARVAGHELRRCPADLRTAVGWARLFHHTLLAACPNRHVLNLLGAETVGLGPLAWPATIGVDELRRVADDHDEILDMIAAGTPRGELERALRRHAGASPICAGIGHP